MKLAIISLTVIVCLFPTLGHAKPVRVTLEWVELDSTQSADLVKAFHGAVFEESSHQIFVDLENSKHRRVLLKHVQQIEPGSNVEHTTQIDEAKFDLSLTVSHAEGGLYDVGVEASLRQAAELLDSSLPATLTASQMKKIPVLYFSTGSTGIKLSHGNSCAVSGLTQRKGDGKTIQILIVSLAEPWNTSPAADPRGNFSEGAISRAKQDNSKR